MRKDPERGRYRLSPLFWLSTAAAFPEVGEAQRRLRSVLPELAQHTGAAATLGVPYIGTRTVGLMNTAFAAGESRPPALSATNAPMHTLAAGKCYLGNLPEEALQEWLKHPLSPLTPHTLTTAAALLTEVRQVRTHGYATDRQEYALGLCSMAVPVRDVTGALAAMVQLSSPTTSLSAATLQAWLPPLQQVAQTLSELCSGLARLP